MRMISTQKREQLTLQKICHRSVHFAKPILCLTFYQSQNPTPHVRI
jgi:hypothetical protein